MKYTRISLEDYVENMYKSIGIYQPYHLNIESVAYGLGLSIIRASMPPMRFGKTIVLDSSLSGRRQWQDFCHELCHFLWHEGNQRNMYPLFRSYQEWKANNFSLYACIPSYMLSGMELPSSRQEAISIIQENFNVEREFAENRLELWMQQRQSHLYYGRIAEF